MRVCATVGTTVQVGLLLDGSRATLIVEDDGPGIEADARERIFEHFVRLDPSRDRATSGCGLGLAIVHSIAHWRWAVASSVTRANGRRKFSFSLAGLARDADMTAA